MELPPNEVFSLYGRLQNDLKHYGKVSFLLDQYDWILGTRPRHWMQN